MRLIRNISQLAENLMDEAAEQQAPNYNALVNEAKTYGPYTEQSFDPFTYNPNLWLSGGPARTKWQRGEDDGGGVDQMIGRSPAGVDIYRDAVTGETYTLE